LFIKTSFSQEFSLSVSVLASEVQMGTSLFGKLRELDEAKKQPEKMPTARTKDKITETRLSSGIQVIENTTNMDELD
jgi:hypothetical protein